MIERDYKYFEVKSLSFIHLHLISSLSIQKYDTIAYFIKKSEPVSSMVWQMRKGASDCSLIK